VTTHVSIDPERVALGTRIRAARKAIGATQQKVAEQVGINRSALSEIEAGRRGLPTGEGIALAIALGTSLDALLADDPPAGTATYPRVPFEHHAAKYSRASRTDPPRREPREGDGMAQDSSGQRGDGMTPKQLLEYATLLVRMCAEDIERGVVINVARAYCPGGTISDADADAVCALLDTATITLTPWRQTDCCGRP